MGFFNVIKNEVKAAVGYQQNFTALLEAKDISRALNYMQDRSGFAEKALLEYKVENHEVMKGKIKPFMIRKGIFLDGKSVGKFLSPISLSSMKLRLFSYMADP